MPCLLEAFWNFRTLKSSGKLGGILSVVVDESGFGSVKVATIFKLFAIDSATLR